MKTIITGASGFVGQNLQAYFTEKKIETTSLSLRNPDWKENFPKNAESIIHLAGKAHDTSNAANPKEYFQVNTELTKQLFGVFLQSEARDFIFFSSVKAVADRVEGVLTESASPNPQTPYGQSKLQAEEYLLSQSLPEGKRLIILRPCMIHGPGNKGNLNLLFKVVQKGIPWPLATFENKRSFLSIDNLCFVLHKIIENKSFSSGVYQLADDSALSTNEIIRLMAETRGKRPKLWKINKSFVEKLARIGNKTGLPLNSERLKKLTESYVVGSEKIKRELGIEKLPVPAVEGLKKTINSFKNQTQS